MVNIVKTLNPQDSSLKILVAPLNWGLGHASRCVPIIKFLQSRQTQIIIACGPDQKHLLEGEFTGLEFVDLPGYDVKYAGKRVITLLKIFLQIPKILIQIKRENRWLRGFLRSRELDAVISDNRYGLALPGVYCVFITHQLSPPPVLGRVMAKGVQLLNYRFINRFSACWVPDNASACRLAGELSHPDSPPKIPLHYIGFLSRFLRQPGKIVTGSLLMVLSGPEPQRSIFEKILLRQLATYNGKVTLVRGVWQGTAINCQAPGVTIFDHLPGRALNDQICRAEYVVCRAGYSSLMDIVQLGKKSIVIPTPGQFEQEYLAQYLHGQRLVLAVDQKGFVLSDALQAASEFSYLYCQDWPRQPLEQTIEAMLQTIRKK